MNQYEILDQQDLEEYNARGTLYKHISSGAEVYHIHCDDKENSFAFSFRTPPTDNSGLPHILEHTVLCGSRRFPIKDPFITLYKGSMHTFLNAYTAPDRTVYPASSVVEKDFFNLMMIYGDAVFFPLLRKEAFMQEGHHMELDEQGNPICVGIVYNEMKGSYSSHESLLAEYSFRELFPETPLSLDSGGEPSVIPSLSYEDFVNFHKTYYHPSNCRIYLYGDIQAEKSLAFLDQHFLSSFSAVKVESELKQVSRWNKPRELAFPSPRGESDGCSHSINWLLGSNRDGETRVALQVISQILIGNAGAPIQMAVQHSDLGEDLSPVSGLELDMQEMVYTLGIRGSGKEQAKDFKQLIFSELDKLVKEGIPKDQIEGALRLVEFREREIRGGLPFGLRLLGRAMRTWNHGISPLEGLRFEEHLKTVRKRAFDKGFWESIIQQLLLENPHYCLVTLYPEDSFSSNLEQAEEQRNRSWLEQLTEDEKVNWQQDLQALRTFQEEEDDPKILESIPFLTREEIPSVVSTIPVEINRHGSIVRYLQPLFTNGVFYVNLGFSLKDFTVEEMAWLPFFCHCLTDIGASELSYDQLAHQISLNLGGIHSQLVCSTPLGAEEPMSHLVLNVKMLEQQIPSAVELVEKVLFHRNFRQPRRIRELLMEMRNDIRTSLIPNGSGYALTRAASVMSRSSAMDELWYGISQYRHMNRAVESWDQGGQEALFQQMEQISDKVFSRLDWVSYTADEDQLERLTGTWDRVVEHWPCDTLDKAVFHGYRFPDTQALQVTSGVCYSAAVMEGVSLDSPSYGSQLIISHLLKAGYLWETLRMKGGAYGASAGSAGLEGYYFFTSYRDPRGADSFKDFRKGLIYLKEHISERDIDLALIGLVGKDLKPLSPAQKASLGVKRHLYGLSDQLRQQNRDRMLKTGVEDLRKELDRMIAQWDSRHRLVLMANREQIDRAAKLYPGFAEQIEELGV